MTKATKKISHPQFAGYISNPFAVMNLSFKAVLSINIGTLVALTLLMLLSIVIAIILGSTILLAVGQARGLFLVLALAVAGVAWVLVLSVALLYYALQTSRGRQVSLGQSLGVGYKKAAGFFGLSALMTVLVIVGFIALVVPGLILLYWFMLAPYIYIDQDISITAALRQSRGLAKKQPVEMFGILAATGIFALPTMVPLIGFLYQIFYNGAGSVALAYRYDSAKALGKKSKPVTHPANYWAMVIVVVLYLLVFAGTALFGWKSITG